MNRHLASSVAMVLILGCCCGAAQRIWASGTSLGGFVPLVGIGLTDETTDPNNLDEFFFVSEPSSSWGGSPLGVGSSAYFDLALLDTGAATHILTPEANVGFDIAAEGFQGTYSQSIGTAGGVIDLDIDLPLGFYAAGLGDRLSAGASLEMDTGALQGQTSFAPLSAPVGWELPNIVGLPMAAQYALAIRNSDPQIFQYKGRTVRTPQVELRDLGSGGDEIIRRAPLKLRPGQDFVTGPIYVFTIDLGTLEFVPTSPTLIPNSGLYLDVDMAHGSKSFEDKEFLLDTGADLTVLSQITAKRLGFDAVLDTPDFVLEIESPGGVEGGVPGFYVDELNIDTVGGNFTLYNVPVAVLDVPDPNDPGNIANGIIGMNAFNGRNLVIDANPQVGQGGVGPSLYIGDPVYEAQNWVTTAASENWSVDGNWTDTEVERKLWDANVANVSGSDQTAVVSSDSIVFQVDVSGTPTADMKVQINTGATLTTFGETLIEEGGRVQLAGGKLDTQFVNIAGGVLAGNGEVFAGTGPIHSPVRNLSGRVEPGDPVGQLTIDGDFSNQAAGTLAIDLGGTTAITEYDRLAVDRFAFLSGILEVSLVDLGSGTFAPAMGNTFTILTAGEGVSGTFDQLLLPGGFQWDVTYDAHNVILEVLSVGGLSGDYNGDNSVDAADYAVWRDAMTAGLDTLPNRDPSKMNGMDAVGEDDFIFWRNHFGETLGGAGASSSAVPEPTSLALLLSLAAMAAACRRRISVAIRPARCAASLRCASSWRK